jgi:hypothetical protein
MGTVSERYGPKPIRNSEVMKPNRFMYQAETVIKKDYEKYVSLIKLA